MAEYETIDIATTDEVNTTRPGSIIDEKISPAIWTDNTTSIVSYGNNHEVYLTSNVISPIEYNKLISFLGLVTTEDVVKFYINNTGGVIDSTFMILHALGQCEATTVACLSGSVMSAATIIALSCDKLEVAKYTQWLSHNYSGGVSGKGSELKAQAEFMTSELENTFYDIHKGFFTDEEIRLLIEDKDYWLGKEAIETRLKNRELLRSGGA